MSDVVLHAIKTFLYERQSPEEGILDGKLYMFKGHVNMNSTVKFHKSIYPTYLIMERFRGPNDRVYYKVFVHKNDANIDLVQASRKNCEVHYFKKPIGAIFLIYNIITKLATENFSFIIEGSSFANLIIHYNRNLGFDYNRHLVNDVLTYFENIDFEMHQLLNPLV